MGYFTLTLAAADGLTTPTLEETYAHLFEARIVSENLRSEVVAEGADVDCFDGENGSVVEAWTITNRDGSVEHLTIVDEEHPEYRDLTADEDEVEDDTDAVGDDCEADAHVMPTPAAPPTYAEARAYADEVIRLSYSLNQTWWRASGEARDEAARACSEFEETLQIALWSVRLAAEREGIAPATV